MQKKNNALDKALRILSTRAHSEKEIIEKLTKAQFDAREIAAAMALLTEYNLVDDVAFAKAWAASRVKSGLGPYRIAHELKQKGITSELREAVLLNTDESGSLHAAIAIAEKHLQKGDENAKRRAFDAICRRGHSFDTARQAITQAERNILECFETVPGDA